jgi:Sulfotransferase family
MSINLEGENLIFLISQPRCGSTLLQRILGSHPSIHTAPEPWIMLHPVYGLKPGIHESEYQANFARDAVENFLKFAPKGEQTYFEGMRHMYSFLYESVLSQSGKKIFLDKTPAYYRIIPELYRTFPKAKYIILFRNPLAVLCSIHNTWVNENWFKFKVYKDDLLKAPKLLTEGKKLLENQVLIANYEDLLSNPEDLIKTIYEKLKIDFNPDYINYDNLNFPRVYINGTKKFFGDPKNVDKKSRPDPKNKGRWTKNLEDPQIWRIANEYLQFLGYDTLQAMGYNYDDLEKILDDHRPSGLSRRLTYSLSWILSNPQEHERFNPLMFKLLRLLRKKGF